MLLSMHLLSFNESYVILTILGSSHGLRASVQKYEKYKGKKKLLWFVITMQLL